MIRRILLAIIVITLLELAILVKLGMMIGFWPMLAVVFGIGAFGLFLARSQGLRTLQAIQLDIARGRMSAPRLLDQAVILLGGVLLLLPGLLSDLAGLTLINPPTRKLIKVLIAKRLGRLLERRYQAEVRRGTDLTDQASYTVIIP